jgi:hypothetical protein
MIEIGQIDMSNPSARQSTFGCSFKMNAAASAAASGFEMPIIQIDSSSCA